MEFSRSSDKKPVLNLSDYNIYDTSNSAFNNVMTVDAYGDAAQDFATLPPWQAALASDFVTLNFDNPDVNSITATPENLFDNLDDKNYIYKVDSPAIGFMPDSSNAGPYQFGNEIIGLLSQWPGNTQDATAPLVTNLDITITGNIPNATALTSDSATGVVQANGDFTITVTVPDGTTLVTLTATLENQTSTIDVNIDADFSTSITNP